ncbi:type IV toxin-antitoxin system AbiEi family antitoxin domain-containing protein [Microbacterium sp. ET2]|uniref:type IV toxin-antitoxin system AbiEi family antitoxin domain-containing protein n=1 Tax=Microbacterium albipurpureum TaxID=3050384 RepID=UPI00259D02C6|nr:type IV toxin-antitoxin system AbiEi family antitoxin domain-containing protein [Microbacterium sp. ET2 (Ac-2212)]WJL95285.1 type IV toxin-antitoxin system AbiEi family antitoxin domain-containing protein [Microbacterium sp. ET2 (Ac-2212)]
MDPHAIAAVIRSHGGIVRGRQLLSYGATRSLLARAVDRGVIARVRSGVFATTEAEPLVLAAAAHGGELCCASALRHLGVWVLDDRARLHVWLGSGGRRHPHPECRCIDHRDAGGSAFGVVSLVQALVQVARCLGGEAFFCALESALRQGLLTRADRAEVRARVSARFRWLVDLARADADSGLESLVRLRLHRLGITVRSQVFISAVGVVDFLIGDRLILEIDGRQNHEGPSLRHKDLVRDAEAAALGYETLRFDYALVIHNWPRVERAILARLARGVRTVA